MQDGIYHVSFATSPAVSGEGLVVVKQGTVNGGDAGYLYIGSLLDTGGAVAGQLKISRWKVGHVSVFGPLDNFELQLNGQITQGGFTVKGGTASMPGVSITIVGRHLAAAA
jgi:T3SS negative regulator,GrlR